MACWIGCFTDRFDWVFGERWSQIDTADELLTLELMLNGVFSSLDAHQLVALVSCLVPSDKSEVLSDTSDALSNH